jgi:glycosyltransferase involved in cell wall biosynthesis
MERLSIILPAYNEEATIGDLIHRIRALSLDGAEIIVVDDGSSDRTAEVASSAGAKVIKHPYNIGNGAAVKTGAKSAKGDVILLMDADGQHQPEDIPKLLEHIEGYDMVVGARGKRARVSLFRSLGNWFFIKVANYLSGEKIPDLTSGFRVIRRKRMEEFLHILPNRFSYPTTLTLSLIKSGYFIKYVMLDTIKNREEGRSKIKPFQDGIRFVIIIARIIMLFSPLRIFLPLSIIFFLVGTGLLIYNLVNLNIQESTILFLLISVLMFSFGLLADQVAHIRREIKNV